MSYSINIAKRSPQKDYTIGGHLCPMYSHYMQVQLPDSAELGQATEALANLTMRFDERDPKNPRLPLYHLTLSLERTSGQYVLQSEQIDSLEHWAKSIPLLKEALSEEQL